MADEATTPVYQFDTQKVRAGYEPKDHNYAVSPPIYQTTSYDFRDVENAKNLFSFNEQGFLYTRVGNPTVAVLEERVRTLDGAGAAIALASGMAALSYTLLNLAEGRRQNPEPLPTSMAAVRTASKRSTQNLGFIST